MIPVLLKDASLVTLRDSLGPDVAEDRHGHECLPDIAKSGPRSALPFFAAFGEIGTFSAPSRSFSYYFAGWPRPAAVFSFGAGFDFGGLLTSGESIN